MVEWPPTWADASVARGLARTAALDTIADALDAALHRASHGRSRLAAPTRLQSWPGIVHGGAVLALFDSAARSRGLPPRRLVEGRLTSSVPVETALDLDARDDGDGVRLTVLDGGQTLASGAVAPLDPGGERGAPPWAGGEDGALLPTSGPCLACGTDNPIGLLAELRFDADGVWVRLERRATWDDPGGGVHAALAFVLLDELSWWLGALVAKEGGLTNRLRVDIARPAPTWTWPLVAAGRYDAVAPIDRRGAFRRVETALVDSAGEALATASIVFRGGSEYSARQLPYFKARTDPSTFARMFPGR